MRLYGTWSVGIASRLSYTGVCCVGWGMLLVWMLSGCQKWRFLDGWRALRSTGVVATHFRCGHSGYFPNTAFLRWIGSVWRKNLPVVGLRLLIQFVGASNAPGECPETRGSCPARTHHEQQHIHGGFVAGSVAVSCLPVQG